MNEGFHPRQTVTRPLTSSNVALKHMQATSMRLFEHSTVSLLSCLVLKIPAHAAMLALPCKCLCVYLSRRVACDCRILRRGACWNGKNLPPLWDSACQVLALKLPDTVSRRFLIRRVQPTSVLWSMQSRFMSSHLLLIARHVIG